MPLRVKVSSRAWGDLARQYGWYLKHGGIEVAERYREAVDVSVQALASFPGLGIARKFKAPRLTGARSYAVKAPFDVHLIFYRADDTTIVVVRVMHGARDLPRRLVE